MPDILDSQSAAPDAARKKLIERLLQQRGIASVKAVASEPQVAPVEPDAAQPEAPPRDSKARTKRFYDGVTRQLDSSMFGDSAYFLNFGYAATDRPQRSTVPLPPYLIDRNSIKLVLETVGDVDLAGARVLDVGCGRGGTVVTLVRYCAVRAAFGLDLSTAAVIFCGRRHSDTGARFTNGDAENLPFRSASFDAVTNIESSHTYPHVESFYREVHRVLAPGGVFLYTDLFLSDQRRRQAVEGPEAIGFEVERSDDITENVIRSCEEIAERRQKVFADRPDADVINGFLGVPGTEFYEAMKNGTSSFAVFRMRKRADR